MESELSPPAKKFRRLARKDINIPLIECKREFKLPQQFPSRVTYLNQLHTLTQPKKLINSLNKDIFITNEDNKSIKKMQLQSKDGKNLGEIKLKPLPSNLRGKTIDYNKLDIGNKINKPVTLSFKHSKKSKKLQKLQEVSLCTKNVSNNNNNDKYNLENSEKKLDKNSYTVSKFLKNDDLANNVTDKNMVSLSESHFNKFYNTHLTSTEILKNTKIQKHKNTVLLSTVNNDILITKKRDNLGSTKESTLQKVAESTLQKDNVWEPSISKANTLEKPTTKVDTSKQSIVKDNMAKKSTMEIESNTDVSSKFKEHLSLIESKFPIVKCDKLIISPNRVKLKELDVITDKSNSNEPNFSSVIENKSSEDTNDSNQNLNILRSKNSTDYNEKAQIEAKNIKTQTIKSATIENKPQTSLITKDIFYAKEIHNTKITSCLKDNSCNVVKPKNKDSCFENTNNSINNNKEETINGIKQQKLSEHLDIIKEALISVTDKELRAKALKALEDCGIGIAKHIPIIPPEKLKTVHDSQIQTDVFGLLDSENFVLVRKDIATLKRIKQTEHSTIIPMTDSNISLQPILTQLNTSDNEHVSSSTNLLQPENDLNNFELCLDQFLNENKNVTNIIQQTLNTPYSLLRNVSTHLTVDYKSLHEWDNNGMLSIHRAVLDNDLQEFKRLLLVLKACKISIDVLTTNEMTCLELAVKTEASINIIQLLLEEGANPILPESVHKSAVIIACRLSSPLLPILLEHVTDHELLNNVDSDGMAPLHYCALLGNLNGVNALLRHEIDVNVRDNRSGRTAIFHALENNHVSIARKLLTHGAITSIKNFSGQSVLTLVEETKNFSLKAALKQIIF